MHNNATILLDNWFYNLLGTTLSYYDVYDSSRPEAVKTHYDIITYTSYSHELSSVASAIRYLLTYCKKLIVYFNEPVNADLMAFINRYKGRHVYFVADAIPNVPVRANFSSQISWFIGPENYYNSSWGQQLILQLEHSVDKPCRFDCLLGTKKIQRDYIDHKYQQLDDNLKRLFVFSYLHHTVSNGIWDSEFAGLDLKYTADVVDYNGRSVPLSSILPVSIYNRSYYSIVSETTDYNDFNQYTEKVAKPILAKRLFVVFAGQHYLRNLRSMGFKTFDSVVDESYDSVADDHSRYDQAWKQVVYLCEQPVDQVLASIQPIVEHNQAVFLNTDWNAQTKQLFI